MSARAASSASASTSGRVAAVAPSRAAATLFVAARPSSLAAPRPLLPQQQQQRKLVARAGSDAPAAPLTAPQPPAGVGLPPRQPDVPEPRFGFVDWAEKINGRACMIGFFALLIVESVAGKGLLELAGATVGQGLGFEL